jgi:hypothetical protein
MRNQEIIDFKIKFTPQFWNRPPVACILIDDEVKFHDAITHQNSIVEFFHTMSFDQKHCLTILRSGKTDDQVRKNPDGSYDDQALIIDQIKIDGIDIRNIIYTDSYNEPSYPSVWAKEQQDAGVILKQYIPGETYLGHNGTWKLHFTSPFYQFIMDKLHG